MILVESDVSEDWDSSSDWPALAQESVLAAIRASTDYGLLESRLKIEVSIRLTNDAEVRALNAAWRGKDRPTNVLSFPMTDPASLILDAEGEALLGDIVVARETAEHEALEKGIPIRDHVTHLLVHGSLHLLGYDHEQGDSEADHMERLERRALASLGIADPYPSEAAA